MKSPSLYASFVNAIRGFHLVVSSERNMVIHVFAMLAVVIAGVYFQVSSSEWIALTICISMVLGAECLNTAIERLADRVEPEKDQLIGEAKDIASTGVLLMAVGSAITAAIIFVPKILALLAPATS
ncbi:MAG: diacylglycerol kinase family protein [Planctomycetota bacterium]